MNSYGDIRPDDVIPPQLGRKRARLIQIDELLYSSKVRILGEVRYRSSSTEHPPTFTNGAGSEGLFDEQFDPTLKRRRRVVGRNEVARYFE